MLVKLPPSLNLLMNPDTNSFLGGGGLCVCVCECFDCWGIQVSQLRIPEFHVYCYIQWLKLDEVQAFLKTPP